MDLIKKCLSITAPVFFGYISIGIPFGLLMANAGYAWWLAPLMCLVMYTGSGQYFMVGLLAGGAGLFEIVVAQFLLSVRHIFYGLTLVEKYRGLGKYKPYLMYAITDETFAIIATIDVPKNVDRGLFYTLISAFDHFYWFLGSLIGSVGFKVLEHYEVTKYFEGVDFALTALFTVLLIGQIKVVKDFAPAAAGIVVSVITVVLYRLGVFSSSNIIWSAICFGMGVMLLLRGHSFFNEWKKNENSVEACSEEVK